METVNFTEMKHGTRPITGYKVTRLEHALQFATRHGMRVLILTGLLGFCYMILVMVCHHRMYFRWCTTPITMVGISAVLIRIMTVNPRSFSLKRWKRCLQVGV